MSRFTELSTVLQSLIRVQEEATEDEDIVLVSDDEVSEDEDLTSGGEDPALVKSRPPAACFYCTDDFPLAQPPRPPLHAQGAETALLR